MLERLAPPGEWPSLGYEAAAWIEHYLRFDLGLKSGESWELTDEQLVYLVDAYRIYPIGHDRVGTRVVSHAVLSRAKGTSKSGLGKAIAVLEAKGPVWFDGWDANGEPVGVPRRGPFIRVMATEEGQSYTTLFGGIVEILKMAQDYHPDVFGDLDVAKSRVLGPHSLEMRPSTASSASKDGGRETCILVDEPHLWTTPELREAYEVVDRNGRKQPGCWRMLMSTMFEPGALSLQEIMWEYAQAQFALPVEKRDERFLYDHREGPDIVDIDDDEEALAAIAEAYGDATWVPPHEVLDQLRDPKVELATSKRYFLNQRVIGDGRCIDPKVWDRAEDLEREIDGPVGLGFDGSLMRANGDSTWLTATTLSAPRHTVVLGVWDGIDDKDLSDEERDEAEAARWEDVEKRIKWAFSEFDVALMYADRARWGVRLDNWAAKWPKRVKAWPATSERRVGMAFRDHLKAVAGGQCTHDGHRVLRKHVMHAVRRKVKAEVTDEVASEEGLDKAAKKLWIASKETRHSKKLIDGYYSAVLSHTAAAEAHAAGYKPKRRRMHTA